MEWMSYSIKGSTEKSGSDLRRDQLAQLRMKIPSWKIFSKFGHYFTQILKE